jgi:hypothetical protein
MPRVLLTLVAFGFAIGTTADGYAGIVFFANFDSANNVAPGVSGGFSGAGSLEGVQGYDGIGNGGNLFGGSFLETLRAVRSVAQQSSH